MTEPAQVGLEAVVGEFARRRPDAPALVAGHVRWSYEELDTEITRAAEALNSLGLASGGGLGLLAGNTADWPVVSLGAHRVGARVDAFNTWVKAYDLDHLLTSSGCEVLVMAPAVRSTDLLSELRALLPELWRAEPGAWHSARYPRLRHVVLLTAPAERPAGALIWRDLVPTGRPPSRFPGADATDPAFVVYTSGSSAAPKAVPLVHRDLVVNGFHIGERMGLRPADRVWFGSPLFWSFGCANALVSTLTHGACLVLQERFAAVDAARLLTGERCTAAYLLPTMVDALSPHAATVRDGAPVRTGVMIGRPEEVRRAAEDLGIHGICNVYGATETYGNCCVTHHDAPLEERLVTQGPPLPGVELRVVDDTGAIRSADATGELQVRGRVMPGYLGQPEATAEVFTEDGWYRTGDRVTLRSDGAVRFRARLTEMIKTSGINVSPAEVESYLCEHPAVVTAAVVGAPHPTRGEVVVAFVTVREEVDASALREWCRDGVAGYKVPWEIVVLPRLPSTATGKIMKRALLDDAARRVTAAEPESRERDA